MADYKEKIKKLLALAESNNEHEAKAALLKAKELMAAHKISEIDLVEEKNKEVRKVYTGVTYTNRKDRWIGAIASTIANNYCCGCAVSREGKGKQTLEVMFIGFEDDVEICANIFKYAIDSCKSCSQYYLENIYKYRCNSKKVDNYVKNSYAVGFANGIYEAFNEQKNGKEAGWGLVMQTPNAVKEVMKSDFVSKNYRGKEKEINSKVYGEGFKEGKKFNPNDKLSA